MSEHDIERDFPEYKAKINKLQGTDKKFTHLATQYNALNRQIMEIEKAVNHHTDAEMEKLKNKGWSLKTSYFK